MLETRPVRREGWRARKDLRGGVNWIEEVKVYIYALFIFNQEQKISAKNIKFGEMRNDYEETCSNKCCVENI